MKNYSFVIKVYTTKSKNLNGAVSKIYQEMPNLVDIVALM